MSELIERDRLLKCLRDKLDREFTKLYEAQASINTLTDCIKVVEETIAIPTTE
jgi:hypothetical protein